MMKRIEKARYELDLKSSTENIEPEKISEASYSSFFKVSSQHMNEGEIKAKNGATTEDRYFYIMTEGCTVDEYYIRETQKLLRNSNPFKPSKATKLKYNNAITNNQIYESREEDLHSHHSMISENPLEENPYEDTQGANKRIKIKGRKVAPSPLNNNLKSHPTASEVLNGSLEKKKRSTKRSSIVCSEHGRMPTLGKDEDKIGVYQKPKKKKRKVIRKRDKSKVNKNNDAIYLDTEMWENSEGQNKSQETQSKEGLNGEAALEYYQQIAKDRVNRRDESLQSEERKD